MYVLNNCVSYSFNLIFLAFLYGASAMVVQLCPVWSNRRTCTLYALLPWTTSQRLWVFLNVTMPAAQSWWRKNMTFHITIDKEEHYVGIIVEGCVVCVEPLVEMRCEELWISPSVHSSNHINASLDLISNSTKSKKSSLVNGQPHLNIFMITYGWSTADWSWVPSPPVYCIAPWCLALLRHVLR